MEQRFVRPGPDGEAEVYAQGSSAPGSCARRAARCPMSELIEEFGASRRQGIPEWIERWGADVALPATKAKAPSLW